MKNLLYILGNFQSENGGDILINDLLIREMSKYVNVHILYVDHKMNCLTQMSSTTLPNVKLKQLDKKFQFQILFNLLFRKPTEYDYLCLVPGHIGFPNFKQRIRHIKNLLVLMLLQVLGLKCIWICKSFDQFFVPDSFFWKLTSKSIHRFSVRDTLSKEINKLDVEVWPDLAFLMPSNTDIHKVTLSTLIFSFRGDRNQETKELIKSFCSRFVQRSLDNHSLKEVICISNVTRDNIFMAELCEFIKSQCTIKVTFKSELSYKEVIKEYKQDSIVLTDRLHVALPAMIQGVLAFPFVDSEKDKKIIGLYQDMGWNKLIVSRSQALDENIFAQIQDSIDTVDMNEIITSINQANKELSSKIAQIF